MSAGWYLHVLQLSILCIGTDETGKNIGYACTCSSAGVLGVYWLCKVLDFHLNLHM